MDDTDLWYELEDADIIALEKEMEHIAVLGATPLHNRRALALEKCFFVTLDWILTNTEHGLRRKEEIDISIKLLLGANYSSQTSISQSSCNEGQRVLDVGWHQTATTAMISGYYARKGRPCVEIFRHHNSPALRSKWLVRQMLRPAITYPLGVTTL